MRIICPACGVTSLVDAQEGSGVIKCTACGKRIHWGMQSAEQTPAVNVEDDIGYAFGIEPASVSQPKAVGAKVGNRTPILIGVVGVIAAAVIVVLVIVAEKAISPQPAVNSASAPATIPSRCRSRWFLGIGFTARNCWR